jgi:hypothetical protein
MFADAGLRRLSFWISADIRPGGKIKQMAQAAEQCGQHRRERMSNSTISARFPARASPDPAVCFQADVRA